MLFALACTFVTDEEWKARLEASCDMQTWYLDEDADGFGSEAQEACEAPSGAVTNGGDCDDKDPRSFPGAPEIWYDGVDQDCAGDGDDDQDGDGYGVDVDCMDGPDDPVPALEGDCAPPTATPDPDDVNPGVNDLSGDGVDANCDGSTDFDGDGDGSSSCGGDCDDEVDTVHPGADEVWYDAVDDNCDGNFDDQDLDGAGIATDCDDLDEERFPGAIEIWYDDVDQDCDGNDDDQDFDGYDEVIDCDDLDAGISPGEAEVWYDGVDQDCDGRDDDRDGDGFGVADDCDETRADVNPDATEACGDSADDNCDGSLDAIDAVGCTAFFVDGDGDGFGGDGTECRCELVAGLTTTGGDCDDGDLAINPYAEERCDTEADDNCSGEAQETGSAGCIYLWADVDGDGYGQPAAMCACEGSPGTSDNAEDCDDADAAVLGPSTWYVDGDADGWGDPTLMVSACDQPAGAVANADDCNDADATQRPDATEDCLTAYDDDCDGDINDIGALHGTCWYLDLDGDGHGAGSCATSCFAEGLRDATTPDDCDDGRASVNPDAEEICGDGVDQDCDGSGLVCTIHGVASVGGADGWLIGPAADESVGTQLAAGAVGLAIGAPDADGGVGHVYLWVGSSEGTNSLGYAALTVRGYNAEDRIGTAVGFVGDIDGDGQPDLGIGGPSSGGWATGGGAFAIVSSASRGSIEWYDTAIGIVPENEYDEVGADFSSAGDIDGDGAPNLVVGAPGANGVGVYPAKPYGMMMRSTGSAWIKGEDTGDRAGEGLEADQDVDGDGHPDLLIAAPGAGSGVGAVYVLLGPTSVSALADADFLITGESASPLGAELALADVDDDGEIDLLAGAPSAGGGAGAIYVLAPTTASTVGDASASILGEGSSDAVGSALSPGDLDGDGLSDLALGGWTSDYVAGGGAAYVFYAPLRGAVSVLSAQATRYGGAADDEAGAAVTWSPDTNGDGYGELYLSATGEDSGGERAGSVYLYLGGGL